jgi:hypothetical protein
LKITSSARASTPKSLMSKAALPTPRFKIRLAPSSPSPAINSLCEEVCCSSDYEQDATHHAACCCLMHVTADEDSSAVFCTRQRHSGTAAPYGSSQNCSSTSNRGARSLFVIEAPAQSDRAFNPLQRRTLERPSALAPKHTGPRTLPRNFLMAPSHNRSGSRSPVSAISLIRLAMIPLANPNAASSSVAR